MQTNQIDKSGAAGRGHLFAVPICLSPFCRLGIGSHIAAQSNLYQVCKANFFQRIAPALKCNALTELSLCGGCKHGIDVLFLNDRLTDVNHTGLGTDRTKRAAVDTSAALDALLFVYDTDAVFIHGDRTNRTAPATWANQIGNGIVGTGCRTFAAFPAFLRVNMRSGASDVNCPEVTGLLTGFAHALLAVVGNDITGDGTVLTGSLHDLYHKVVVRTLRRFSLCQADALTDDLTLFIDAAAVFCFRTGHHPVGEFFFFLFKFSGKDQLCHLT